MANVGDVIRVALLKIMAERLSSADFEEFSTWLREGRVAKYYFDHLLNLKAVTKDLRTISENWGVPYNEKHLAALTYSYEAEEIMNIVKEKFPDFETFYQWKSDEIETNFVGINCRLD